MKIIPENIIKVNSDIVKKQNQGKSASESGLPAKSAPRDKITIESAPAVTLSDAELVAQLKKSILNDIQAGADRHKLNDLKRQIALEEYDVNIPEVVKKIMLDAENTYE